MPHRRRISPPFRIDLPTTLAGIQRGVDDPTMRFAHDGSVWRATRTPDGPATIHLAPAGDGVEARAWGEGAGWALEQAPALIGCFDDDRTFDAVDPVISRLRRRLPGLRLGRTDNVLEALIPAVLEHRVATFEATRAFRQVMRAYGEPAPGPGGLVVPPHPEQLAGVPYYDLHIRGVEPDRADTLLRVCAHAGRLPQLLGESSAEAQRRLLELPGVDEWAAAEVAANAFGDPDAVSLGDEHLPGLVSWFFTGETDADDTRMLELLAPWAGHRARVIRLFEASGLRPPRTAHAPARTTANSP